MISRNHMQSRQDIYWLLTRIKFITAKNRPNWSPNRGQIFAGSYDVWSCEQDKIDSMEIPKRRLNETRALGLVENESQSENWGWYELWHLAKAGEKFLEEWNNEM